MSIAEIIECVGIPGLDNLIAFHKEAKRGEVGRYCSLTASRWCIFIYEQPCVRCRLVAESSVSDEIPCTVVGLLTCTFLNSSGAVNHISVVECSTNASRSIMINQAYPRDYLGIWYLNLMENVYKRKKSFKCSCSS